MSVRCKDSTPFDVMAVLTVLIAIKETPRRRQDQEDAQYLKIIRSRTR